MCFNKDFNDKNRDSDSIGIKSKNCDKYTS